MHINAPPPLCSEGWWWWWLGGGGVVYKLRGSILEHMHCKLRLWLLTVSVSPCGFISKIGARDDSEETLRLSVAGSRCKSARRKTQDGFRPIRQRLHLPETRAEAPVGRFLMHGRETEQFDCAVTPCGAAARSWRGASAEPHKLSAITSVKPCLRITNILSLPPGCLAAEWGRGCVMCIMGNQISWEPSSCFRSKTTRPLN